ncbi:MAG TPA: CBS domain-containing protein [Burkholderiales bacterium]|nr:CBS domain-containing protein [Burkholderiales bacterium]
MRVGDFCIREVIECHRKASALELSQLMRDSHVGDVVVVDQPNGKKVAVGIVTDRDLVVEVMAKEVDPALVTAGDLMGRELVTVGEGSDIFETVELMRHKGVRRIPVVDDQGGLAGIVTLDDLLKVVGEQIILLAQVIGRERFQEQQSRH